MTDSVELDLSELRRLDLSMTGAAVRVGLRTARVLRKTGYDIVHDGQALLVAQHAVDTGNLLNSVGVTFAGDGRTGSMSLEAGPTADYGHFVEGGTSRMPPRPYMGPAFDRRAPLFEAALGKIGEDGMLA